MEKTSKCVKRVVYVCPTPDNCGYFEQYKDKPFCCKYRTDGNAICTCKEAIEEAKGQPKRTPLPDGTLELTEEERDEFKQFFDGLPFHRVKIIKYLQEVHFMYEALLGEYYITNIKAILWLADRFNLEGNNDIQSR